MVIRLYVSSTSGNMEIKKKQEHIRQVLDTRKIAFEEVDVASPENETEKQFMRDNAEPEEGKNFVLPPQIFNDQVYCGDAVEIDNLPEFLKLYLQEEEEPVVEEVVEVQHSVKVFSAPPTKVEDMPKANEGKTLLPYADFKCESDCEKLHDAMKGFGTDEKTIIEILGHRSKGQTQEIISMYQQMFGKDLIEELKGELSGSFKTVIVGLCQPQSDFDAQQLRKAMKRLGTDEQCLIDILCTRTNAEIHDIIQAYKRLHKRDLKDDVASESSGDFRRLLISVLNANRSEETEVDIAQVRQDAKDLYEAGEASLGTDESVYNRVLCLRSYDQLMAVFGEYQSITGRDIEESIESELSGDLKRGMMAVATSVRSVAGYFADALYESMSGLGTSDDRLIRICVSRCEIDMVQIKKEFKRKYGQPLADMIVGDISGDYKKIILAIIGEEGYN